MSGRLIHLFAVRAQALWRLSEVLGHPAKRQSGWILEENIPLCGKGMHNYPKLLRHPQTKHLV
jgi:hypothetical protein